MGCAAEMAWNEQYAGFFGRVRVCSCRGRVARHPWAGEGQGRNILTAGSQKRFSLLSERFGPEKKANQCFQVDNPTFVSSRVVLAVQFQHLGLDGRSRHLLVCTATAGTTSALLSHDCYPCPCLELNFHDFYVSGHDGHALETPNGTADSWQP